MQLRLVIDLETVGTGEPEFDLRCLPGDCGIELFSTRRNRRTLLRS